MGLLNPLALAFTTLSIPIIIFYMLRLRRRAVQVSSTLLWQQLLRDREANTPWQRLRRNLLLILQLIALAILTLALSRPFIETPTITNGSVVILLDASASMQARDIDPSRFEAARQAAEVVLNGMGAQDIGTIILVDSQPSVLASSTDVTALRRALSQAKVTNGIADWETASALAAAVALGSDEPETVIISDGAIVGSLPPLVGEIHFIRIGEQGSNLAITSVATRLGSGGIQALISVANLGSEHAEGVLELYADGALFDAYPVDIPPGERNITTLHNLSRGSTILEARIAGDDLLSVDNAGWAVISPPREQQVLLITPGNLFLERALQTLEWIELTRLSPDQPITTDSYDLVVHDGPITRTLPSGNVWAIGPYTDRSGDIFTDTQITRSDDDDPLLRFVDLDQVHILEAWNVEPPPGARTLIEASGRPLLFTLERPEGRTAVLTFDLHNSDLPLRIAFPVLTSNLVDWLLPSAGPGALTSTEPGEPYRVPLLPNTETVIISTPHGNEHRIPASGTTVFLDTNQLGVYNVAQYDSQGDLIHASPFVVNIFDESESDITPRDLISIGQRELPITESAQKGQRETWPWLAGAALVVFGLEWWVHHRGTGSLRAILVRRKEEGPSQ
jgi:hypothetical protein